MDWLRSYDYGAVNPGPPGCPETTYSFDYQNAHFVVLNEYCDAGGDTATSGDVPDHLYNWLAADLSATDKTHIFVFGHEPAYPQPDADNGRIRHLGDSLDQYPAHRDRFWNLLRDERVVAYICGHTHNYSAAQIDGVWQLDAGHARGRGDTGARSTFILVDVDPSGVTFRAYRDDANGGPYTLAHTGTLRRCVAGYDLDCDCDVDIADIMLVASRWHSAENYDPLYDLDDDSDIDIVDIMLVAVHWGESCKESPFGMGIYLYRYLDNPELMETMTTLAEEANILWDREEFTWHGIEPPEEPYDFSGHDAMVDIAERHGINVYGLVVEFEDLDTPSPYTEEHFESFADFVSTLVDRYRGRIKYWEIWNEPELSEYWKPEPNAFNYFQLLKHAYIKAKETDPSVKIIGLATDSGALDFIEEVFQYGGLDYMDIVAIHPYSYPDPIETSYQFQAIAQIRELMRTYETEKPIWVTEVGYPTHVGETGVSEDRQAELLVRTYLALISSGIEVVTWYDFVNDGDDIYDREANFGVLKSDLTPKKAYHAYQTMTALLEGYAFIGELNVGEQSKALLFENEAGGRILVLWTLDQELDVELAIDGQVENIFDIYGEEVPYTISGNSIGLTISGSPIYITGHFEVLGLERVF